jgi:tRNA uridine 5-carbamoylmethylation protein Kti12
MGRVPKEWRKICVFFATPEPDELQRRLDSRVGKSIPKNVMDSMIQHLEEPTLKEGWDEIIVI